MGEEHTQNDRHRSTLRGFGFGDGRKRSNRKLTATLAGAAVLLVLFRLGFFDGWGEQPPVQHILSEPADVIIDGESVRRFWLHVPVGTSDEVTEELLSTYLIPQILRSNQTRKSNASDEGGSTPRVMVFGVYSEPKPDVDEIKTAGVDDPDSWYRWSADSGLTRT